MVVIYKKQNYRIYDAGNNEYIIHDASREFESAHSHVKNFKTCKYIIDLCIHKTVPYHLSEYLLISILRLSDDEKYKEKIRNQIRIMQKNRKHPVPQHYSKNKRRNY